MFTSFEELIAHLETQRGASCPADAIGHVMPQNGCGEDGCQTLVNGVFSDMALWLSEQDLFPATMWVLGEQHILAKMKFASIRAAWGVLDRRPVFEGKWLAIERARSGAAQWRTIPEALKWLREKFDPSFRAFW